MDISNDVFVQAIIQDLETQTGPPDRGKKTAKTLSLDVGEDRVLLHAHPSLYHMDIYLPFDVNSDEAGAQFNKDNKVLTVTLPVHPFSV